MTKIEKILAATDFSEGSEAAVRYAVETGARLGASVCLLHVYALPTYPVLPGGESFVVGPQVAADYLHGVHEEMKRLEQKLGAPATKIEFRTLEGPIAATIVRVAREEGYDLIVLGTHGRRGLERLWVGSIAERVVRTASTPVLTLRDAAHVAELPFKVPVL